MLKDKTSISGFASVLTPVCIHRRAGNISKRNWQEHNTELVLWKKRSRSKLCIPALLLNVLSHKVYLS